MFIIKSKNCDAGFRSGGHSKVKYVFAVYIEIPLLRLLTDVVKKYFGHTTKFIRRQEPRRLMMDINAF